MYTGVDTAVQILCKYIHTSAHRHSYTKLRQLRRGVKWGSPFREEEDTRTPTRTIWCIGVQYIHGYVQTMHKRFSSRLAHMCTCMHIVVQSLHRRFYLQRPPPPPHWETKTVAHLGKRPKYISMLGGMGGVSIVMNNVIIVIISITLISTLAN